MHSSTLRSPSRSRRFRTARQKDRGIALGDEVAAQIVALRANDGSGDGLAYTPPVGLGLLAARSRAPEPARSCPGRRDTLDHAQQPPSSGRSLRPPSLDQLFADDLAELKAIGGMTSSFGPLDQECTARFTTDNPVAQYHRLARIVAQAVPSRPRTQYARVRSVQSRAGGRLHLVF